MAIAVNDIVANVRDVLLDTDSDNYRWSSDELIGFLNEGSKMVVINKSDANTVFATVQLSSGTEQDLPTGGIQLIDVVCNMGTTGTTPGRTCPIVDKRKIDTSTPTWHSDTAAIVVKNVVYDKNQKNKFYVYPQSNGTNYIRIVHSAIPTIVSAGDNIVISDVYETALFDWILFRAFLKDSDISPSAAQRASFHLSSFSTAVGAQMKAEDINDGYKEITDDGDLN